MDDGSRIAEIGQLAGTRPILLSGVYRSGTTFLAAVVNSLPNVVAASSTVKYLRFCLPHHHNLNDDAALERLLSEIQARIGARWSLTLDLDGVHRTLGSHRRTHARVYDAVMKTLLLSDEGGATRWAEKINVQWRDIPLFLKMFPQGQAIHIVRDPRDVTASYKNMTYEPWPTFMDAALNCKASMSEVRQFQKEIGEDRILILKAEDLAQDLAGHLQIICDFLSENFDDAMADLEKFPALKGEEWRSNTSFEATEQNYAKASRRWETHLSAEELFLTELICQPQMAEYGYPGSGQDITALQADTMGKILSDPWFAGQLNSYLSSGRPTAGYRSDPYATEMKIVFGDPDKDQ